MRLEAQTQTSLDRHVYGGHVGRLVHELMEGTERQDRLQSSPNTFALVESPP